MRFGTIPLMFLKPIRRIGFGQSNYLPVTRHLCQDARRRDLHYLCIGLDHSCYVVNPKGAVAVKKIVHIRYMLLYGLQPAPQTLRNAKCIHLLCRKRDNVIQRIGNNHLIKCFPPFLCQLFRVCQPVNLSCQHHPSHHQRTGYAPASGFIYAAERFVLFCHILSVLFLSCVHKHGVVRGQHPMHLSTLPKTLRRTDRI